MLRVQYHDSTHKLRLIVRQYAHHARLRTYGQISSVVYRWSNCIKRTRANMFSREPHDANFMLNPNTVSAREL